MSEFTVQVTREGTLVWGVDTKWHGALADVRAAARFAQYRSRQEAGGVHSEDDSAYYLKRAKDAAARAVLAGVPEALVALAAMGGDVFFDDRIKAVTR